MSLFDIDNLVMFNWIMLKVENITTTPPGRQSSSYQSLRRMPHLELIPATRILAILLIDPVENNIIFPGWRIEVLLCGISEYQWGH